MAPRRLGTFASCIAVAAIAAAWASECAALPQIQNYIKRSWTTLQRSNATLDTKVDQKNGVVVYVPRSEDKRRIAAGFHNAGVRVETLPDGAINHPGLLYLPYPYVVPGGRFNEMYGWDSYFILLGLIRDGEIKAAKDMTGDFLYEVAHYGKVLNANRTYYLTRSQPPFLTRMILEVYRRTGDLNWLRAAMPEVEKYYAYWTRAPHLTPATGLARYWGGADTPAPEVEYGERDSSGNSHYDRVAEYFRAHPDSRFFDANTGHLTSLFFQNDRAMRESGFDPSGRFGLFGSETTSYNPVDLNSLLCAMEMDASAIETLLDHPRQASEWSERARVRRERINRLMWNAAQGLYFDYDFERKRESGYVFITTFYPLWAGIATPEQAAKVAANVRLFERAGGLQTSTRVTGNQWDAPFGWAPMQLIAVEGLRRYGLNDDANRISVKFLSMVLRDFVEHGTIKEKYDVVAAKSDLASGVKFGYTSNEIGFGWTNAAFAVLYDKLSPAAKQSLNDACTIALHR